MGTIVLSIDAELGWGFHDLDNPPAERIAAGRAGWETLLELLDEYSIPATWAVVGHLMLSNCDGQHEDHPAPRGWFNLDPGGSSNTESQWFAPDLIKSIQQASVAHEIASHSFSHVPFRQDWVSESIVDAELKMHQTLAETWGISLESFIFPRNEVAFRDRLALHGFRAYRGEAPSQWYDEIPGRPIGKAVSLTISPEPVAIVEPEVDEYGLLNIPSSLDLFGFEGPARTVSTALGRDPIVRGAHRAIDQLVDHDGIFHMWLHPNNLTSERDRFRLIEIFEYADNMRSAGRIEIAPMRMVAEKILH